MGGEEKEEENQSMTNGPPVANTRLIKRKRT
jgi:hypothetical protein